MIWDKNFLKVLLKCNSCFRRVFERLQIIRYDNNWSKLALKVAVDVFHEDKIPIKS